MPDFVVDLNNCDREPIHIPGKIQSHGFLIAIDQDLIIQFASENISSFVPEAAIDLTGFPVEIFEGYLKRAAYPRFVAQLIQFARLSKGFD